MHWWFCLLGRGCGWRRIVKENTFHHRSALCPETDPSPHRNSKEIQAFPGDLQPVHVGGVTPYDFILYPKQLKALLNDFRIATESFYHCFTYLAIWASAAALSALFFGHMDVLSWCKRPRWIFFPTLNLFHHCCVGFLFTTSLLNTWHIILPAALVFVLSLTRTVHRRRTVQSCLGFWSLAYFYWRSPFNCSDCY